jgi:hypothetical protein
MEWGSALSKYYDVHIAAFEKVFNDDKIPMRLKKRIIKEMYRSEQDAWLDLHHYQKILENRLKILSDKKQHRKNRPRGLRYHPRSERLTY